MTLRLVALAVLDAVLMFGCALGAITPGWSLAGHALLTAMAYAIWLRGPEVKGYAAATFGILGPAALLLVRRIDARTVTVLNDEAMFGPAPRPGTHARRPGRLSIARLLDGRIHHAAPETLGSFVTILRYGDVAARRRALEVVVRSFEPSLSPLIAQALTDGDQTIRALAAAASSRVAQNLATAREDANGTLDAAMLAALLADHARADVLLSDSQRGHLREDAIALLPAADAAQAALAIEAAWAAGDYAAIDRLVAADASAGGAMPDWWRSQVAA